MRVVFFGTPEEAVPSLESLAGSAHETSLVVTQPSRRRHRRGRPSPSPVAAASARLGLGVLGTSSVRTTEFLARISAEKPDLLVVVAYGRIFPPELLERARFGAVNLHFSLLPRYRGAAPVQWAIAEGETETGVTTLKMNELLDAGPILLQQHVSIDPQEHAPRLGARLAATGAALLLRTIEGIAAKSLGPREQDHGRATLAPMLRAEDGWIDWSMPADRIVRRVRAFDPWPGQSTRAPKGKIRILEARSGASPGVARGTAGLEAPQPGIVLEGDRGSAWIVCGDGSVLEALTVQREGRRAMAGVEALRGRHLSPGERLGGHAVTRRG